MSDVRVNAPSRLHFGLFSFGNPAGREFGGVGVMVDEPRLSLRIRPARSFSASGACSTRVAEFVASWKKWNQLKVPPACSIEVVTAPPMHAGLGVGTQLGLAIATGLNAFVKMPPVSPEVLAASVGRGRRSAVGTFGFLGGGLIIEEGKLPGEILSPLWRRLPLPDDWRFIVITPAIDCGLSVARENAAFGQLAPVPPEVTAQLIREATESMAPAVRSGRFDDFCGSVYRYGRLAGSCFAKLQGGPYQGPFLADLVDKLVAAGFTGVGQSSWGPTIFALTPDESTAVRLVTQVKNWPELADARIVITSASNTGASVIAGSCG